MRPSASSSRRAVALNSFQQITLGPSGDLFASDRQGGRVLRYDGATGAFVGTFVDMGSGGLGEPTGLDFGTDGDLYVADGSSLQVLRYDGSTGAFVGVAGDLTWPGANMFPKFLVAVPIPESSTNALMLVGLAAVGVVRKMRSRAVPVYLVESPSDRPRRSSEPHHQASPRWVELSRQVRDC